MAWPLAYLLLASCVFLRLILAAPVLDPDDPRGYSDAEVSEMRTLGILA